MRRPAGTDFDDTLHNTLMVAPMIGAVVLTWWLGAYALVFGVSLVVLAFRLRARLDRHKLA